MAKKMGRGHPRRVPHVFHWGSSTIEMEADSYDLAKLLDEIHPEENERKNDHYRKQWLI